MSTWKVSGNEVDKRTYRAVSNEWKTLEAATDVKKNVHALRFWFSFNNILYEKKTPVLDQPLDE